MIGVHYRFDSHEGLALGEAVAFRRLHQVCMYLLGRKFRAFVLEYAPRHRTETLVVVPFFINLATNALLPHLVQEIGTLPEDHFYEFHLFTGETIKLDHTGDFYIDGQRCSGAAFTGVNDC